MTEPMIERIDAHDLAGDLSDEALDRPVHDMVPCYCGSSVSPPMTRFRLSDDEATA